MASGIRPFIRVCVAVTALWGGALPAGASTPHGPGMPGGASDEARSGGSSVGRDAYLRHCARCHQRDGRGIEGLYPSLHDLETTARSRADAIRGLLAGRIGTLDIDGGRFDNVMPSHGYLGNETIAATLSYVLTAWSGAGEPVSAEEVAAQRLALLTGHPQATEPVSGDSPLADMKAAEYVTTDGPPMTVDEFEQARRLFYGRCTGCHGVLRQGTAGNPLTPDLMRQRGSEYLKSVISYGSSTGMPDWGTSGTLSGAQIDLLARFLQHPVPEPPDMNRYQIRDGWRQYRIPEERPSRPRHDYDVARMFAVTLHDVGQIAILDGDSKTLIARVPACRSPHRVAASASARYLYVMCRDGTVAMIDLFASPPERVASVRIGYEARALAASRVGGDGNGFVLAGAYWPPQLVLLDGATLEPLRVVSTRGYVSDGHRYNPEPRVSDVAPSPFHPEFISQVKETGHVYLFGYGTSGDLPQVVDLEAAPELRAGSFSSDGRYYLTPADTNAISVLDVKQRAIVAVIPARVFSGNPGVSYVDATRGPVWVTTTMVDSELIVVGTDPEGHPDQAWKVLERVQGPSSGSMFLATDPRSPHLWMDTPLNADPEHSQSVAVFDKAHLSNGYRRLPVARWSGLRDGARRAIQPAYSADGREVWMVVWNPQDRESAVVVVDDRTLQPIASIRRSDLVTPTRIYSVAALAREAAATPADSGKATAGPPATSETVSGAALYANNCANCHGRYGEGDGPVAPSLSTPLKDLRYLSARNRGTFPDDFVRQIVDGRAVRAAHRPADMPVWGTVFAGGAGGNEKAARQRVGALVRFLESIQLEREN